MRNLKRVDDELKEQYDDTTNTYRSIVDEMMITNTIYSANNAHKPK